MSYRTGLWGIQAQERSKRRNEYFKNYRRLHPQERKPNSHQYHGKEGAGYKGEMLGLKILVGAKRINRPCDLSWNGKLVDVKTSKPIRENGRKNERWLFQTKKQDGIADLFLLIRKDLNDKVLDIYLLPSKVVSGKKYISFTERGAHKYSQYLLSLG